MPPWTTEGKCKTYVFFCSVPLWNCTLPSIQGLCNHLSAGELSLEFTTVKFQFLSFLPAFLSVKLLLLTHFLELLVSFQIQSTTVSSLLLYSPSLGGEQ